MIQRGVKFTAVLAFDDLTGLGAIRALHQAGINVPNACSVIGFDDIPLAALSTPGLTTIRPTDGGDGLPSQQNGCSTR